MNIHRSMIGTGVAAACWAACAASGQTYTVVDLGSADGGSSAFAISADGRVAGYSSMSSDNNRFHGTVWDGSLSDIGVFSPWDQSAAFAFDGAGNAWAVGYAFITMTPKALVYSNGGLSAVADFAPRGANAAGTVVGAMPVISGLLHADHACSFAGNVLTDLGTLGGDFSHAQAVNDSGWIVGSSTTTRNLATHATLWKDGAVIDLGTLGGTRSRATAINNARQVVGVSDTAAGDPHACLWTLSAAGAVVSRTDLGALAGNNSCANAIESSGLVVGTSDGRATLWRSGSPVDLNTLIAASPGWQLESAHAIDSQNRIAGSGWLHGLPRAFLLVCRADFDGSGFIDTDDFDAFVYAFTEGGPEADYDASGFVDTDDFDAFVRAFEAGC